MSPDIELWNVCRSAFHAVGVEAGDAATRKRRAILRALRDEALLESKNAKMSIAQNVDNALAGNELTSS